VFRTWWQRTQDWFCTSHGPFLDLTLMYQVNFLRHLGLQVGYQASLVFLEANDNGYPQDNWTPPHLHQVFIGLAI